MPTIYFGFILVSAVCVVLVVLLRVQNGGRFQGTGLWVLGFVLQFTGTLFLPLRVFIPSSMVIFMANILLIGGVLSIKTGIEQFCSLRSIRLFDSVLFGVFAVVVAFASFSQVDTFRFRVVLFSLVLAWFSGETAVRILVFAPRTVRQRAGTVGGALGAYSLVSGLRALLHVLAESGFDLFHVSGLEVAVIFSFAICYLVLVFALTLAVNNRLLAELASDVSIRKKTEAVIRLRLSLWEYSQDHDYKDLMRRALDEIESITQSKIGFFHFYDESKEQLALQVWSSRTLRDFCHVTGNDTMYDIERAGVWADAVRQKKPLVHNDYSSLADRKGMPEGHAPVFREAVAPVLRQGRVVAVMGLGNKEEPYSDDDMRLVSFLADTTFSFVERKQTEARIEKLNADLARQAMTDELTKLPNRRSFFRDARREFGRARRYGYPCVILMLDLDGFKAVNDQLGHDAGDRVLKRLAALLRKGVRDTDYPARLGGEEFAVLLADTGTEDALVMAERIRASVEKAARSTGRDSMRVTVSIGVAGIRAEDKHVEDMVKRADEALYAAKAAGKNRVQTAT